VRGEGRGWWWFRQNEKGNVLTGPMGGVSQGLKLSLRITREGGNDVISVLSIRGKLYSGKKARRLSGVNLGERRGQDVFQNGLKQVR